MVEKSCERRGAPHQHTEGRPPSKRVETLVGFLLGVVGLSNLVQGAWLPYLPWLNLTLFAPVGLVVLILLGVPGPRQGRPAALFCLLAAFVPGYIAIELNPGAPENRMAIALAVLIPLVVVYLVARSSRILNGFAVGVILLSGIVFAAQWVNPDLEVLTRGRRTPEGLNAIGAGRALGLGALVCLVQLTRSVRRSGRQLAWLGLAGMFAAGAIAAASRGPLLGLVVGGLAVLLVSVELTPMARVGLVSVAVGSVVLAVRDFVAEGSRVVTAGDSGRSQLFSATWDIAMNNPAGIGWGNLYNYLPPTLVSSGQGYDQYPHNVLLEVLVAGGWVALVLLLVGIAVAGWAAYCSRRLPLGSLLWGTFLYAFSGALFSSSVVGNRLLWVVCAMSLGIWGRQQLALRSGVDQDWTASRPSQPSGYRHARRA